MMRNLPEKVHDDDIKEMFDFADANQDGKIIYEEFQIMINPPEPPEEPRLLAAQLGLTPQRSSPVILPASELASPLRYTHPLQ